MSKFAILLIGLLAGMVIGTIIGVSIDKDYYIHGKVKQKGKNNIQDVTSNLNLKKQQRKQKRLLKKSK